MNHLTQRNLTLCMLFSALALIWQGCEPPVLPDCGSDSLFRTSASISYTKANPTISILVRAPQTCNANVFDEANCNSAHMTLGFEFKDCGGNVVKSEKKTIDFRSQSSKSGLDWNTDPKGGTVLSNGQTLYMLSLPGFDGDFKSLDLTVSAAINQEQACNQPDGTTSNFIIQSMNFYHLDGSLNPQAADIFNDTDWNSAVTVTYSDILITDKGC